MIVELPSTRFESKINSATLDRFVPCVARPRCLLASHGATPDCFHLSPTLSAGDSTSSRCRRRGRCRRFCWAFILHSSGARRLARSRGRAQSPAATRPRPAASSMRTARDVWLSAGRLRAVVCGSPLPLTGTKRGHPLRHARWTTRQQRAGHRAGRQRRRGARRGRVAPLRWCVVEVAWRRVATLCGRRRRARRPRAHRRSAHVSCASCALRAAPVGRRARAVCAPVVCRSGPVRYVWAIDAV